MLSQLPLYLFQKNFLESLYLIILRIKNKPKNPHTNKIKSINQSTTQKNTVSHFFQKRRRSNRGNGDQNQQFRELFLSAL